MELGSCRLVAMNRSPDAQAQLTFNSPDPDGGEPARGQRCVVCSMSDVGMAEEVLDQSGVHPLVRQGVASRMAQGGVDAGPALPGSVTAIPLRISSRT